MTTTKWVCTGDSQKPSKPNPKDYRNFVDKRSKIADRINTYNKQLAAWNTCVEQAQHQTCARPTLSLSELPPLPKDRPKDEADPLTFLSPQQLAYAAMANLLLPKLTPEVTPDPRKNDFHMTAVGFPQWLAVDGDSTPRTSHSNVYGLTVTLRSHLDKVIFDMGDGHRVSCTNVTTRWNPTIEAGAKSPVCGYIYQRPSLPRGDYTITARAYWSVDWEVNGVTGTIPIVQAATTDIPVGELQVLVR